MFSISLNKYTILCDNDGLPEDYAVYKENAEVVEEFDLEEAEGSLCFVGIQGDGDWPFLVVAQRFSPAGFGFDPGVQLVEETDVLFVGAGERLLAYDLKSGARLWEDRAEIGFSHWSRHEETILMSAELELAAWNLEGRKLWSTSVEPPWSYSIENGIVEIDVMGVKSSFDVERGPNP